MNDLYYEVKDTLNKNIVETKAKCVFYMSDGSTQEVALDKMKQGSLSINNKCVSGSDFETGSVYSGELELVVTDTEITDLLIGNEKVEAYYYLKHNEEWKELKLGTFYISSGFDTFSISGVDIKAYDRMLDLSDDNIVIDTITGQPYDILLAISNASGIPLAQSRAEIEVMTNGTQTFTYTKGNVSTARDLLSDLAQVLMCFATITNEDKLKLCQMSKNTVLSLDGSKKTNTSISTYYVGISNVVIEASDGYTSGNTGRVGREFYIKDNSLCVNKTTSELQTITNNVTAYLTDFSYVPASFDLVIGNPFIELGDRIKITGTGIHNVLTYETICMSYEWQFRGKETIKGLGQNPRFAKAETKAEKRAYKAIEQAQATSKEVEEIVSGGGSGGGSSGNLRQIRTIKKYKVTLPTFSGGLDTSTNYYEYYLQWSGIPILEDYYFIDLELPSQLYYINGNDTDDTFNVKTLDVSISPTILQAKKSDGDYENVSLYIGSTNNRDMGANVKNTDLTVDYRAFPTGTYTVRKQAEIFNLDAKIYTKELINRGYKYFKIGYRVKFKGLTEGSNNLFSLRGKVFEGWATYFAGYSCIEQM